MLCREVLVRWRNPEEKKRGLGLKEFAGGGAFSGRAGCAAFFVRKNETAK